MVEVSSRAMGFVEKLHVRATLDRVAAGAPLVELHIPDWVAAQEEYLAVARMTGPGVDALRDAARARMRQAGMDETLIDRVASEGRVLARVTLASPIGGVVSELMVREGATVMPGTPLLRLQGTGSVWAEGQVPESQASLLEPGARVSATSPAAPGRTFDGRVQALLPEVDAGTRTLKARLELANPGARLVPGFVLDTRSAGNQRERDDAARCAPEPRSRRCPVPSATRARAITSASTIRARAIPCRPVARRTRTPAIGRALPAARPSRFRSVRSEKPS